MNGVMAMNVNIPQMEELVRNKVASGFYTSASEVVREALRLMDAQDRIRETKLIQLRQDIQEGLDSGGQPLGILTRLNRKAAKDGRQETLLATRVKCRLLSSARKP